jgi:hypothetical protein
LLLSGLCVKTVSGISASFAISTSDTITHVPFRLAAVLIVALAAPAHAEADGAFAKGQWTGSVVSAVLIEAWDYNLSQEEIYGGAIGVAYCPRDRVSIGVEVMLARVVQNSSDAFLKGASSIFGWQAWHRGQWSVAIETGLGVSTADVAVPRRGTRFNYLAHGGATAIWRVTERCHVMGSLRWLHLSNNSLAGRDRNPDIQALGGHVGVRVPL